MRTTLVLIALAIVTASAAAVADEYVNGYLRDDGTYVQGYWRSSPNSTRLDNYSTRGNVNPYTGEKGYRDPYDDYDTDSHSNYGYDSDYGYDDDYGW